MPVSIGDDYPYLPRPFVVAFAAVALPTVSVPTPAAVGMSSLPAPGSALSSVTHAGPVPAPAAAPAPAVASSSAPAVAPGPAPASATAPALASASAPAPAPVPAAVSDPALPPAPALAVPLAPEKVSVPVPVVAASSAAVGAAFVPPQAAPAVAPSAAAADPSYQPPLATSAGPSQAEVQSTHVAPLIAPSGQSRRPQSSGRRPYRPHSPLPRDEHESSRRRQDSPRGRRSQGNWTARRGGRGGWWGGRDYGRGAASEEPPITPAEIRQLVTAAVRDAQTETAGPSHPPHAAPRPGLWRLSESLRVLLLVQVTAHASLPPVPADSLLDGPRDDCLDAADQLALLLAPVLAAPVRGGVAAVGQLDASVRGLRRYLRAGSGADVIASSTLVVREVWRTLSGLLAALEADRM
ncbi:unnamed protein product [Closterium sp. Naga37s-1]|nr:unnamed protein product [Closterium sp. Naga37s-1]